MKEIAEAGAVLRRLVDYVESSYGDKLEFLWEDFDSAIWRNQRNRKWYGIIQHVNKSKLGIDEELKDEDKQKIQLTVIATIDKQTDEIQSVALAYLLSAYAKGKMTKELFVGVAHELESISPSVFDFNSAWSQYTLNGGKFEQTNYLPSAFYTTETPTHSVSIPPYATPLGKTFMECVYIPMLEASVGQKKISK